MIYFGGNAEDVENRAARFSSAFPGHTVYLVAYRGYGASGGKPTQRDIVGDGIALHAIVAGHHPDGVDVIGRSLGSAVAMQVCARATVRRLVLVTPLDSAVAVAEHHLPTWAARLLIADRWDSISAARDLDATTLVVRAGKDQTIPPACTSALVAVLPAARIIDFPEADHDSVVETEGYLEAIEAFLADDKGVGESSAPSC